MIKRIDAKKLVYSVKNGDGWFGVDYNMNIYRGCHHGCIYCDSRSSVYQLVNFDEVRAKNNISLKLKVELASIRKVGVVSMGAMSDPYNKFEDSLELTRDALKVICEYGFGVNVVTKSDLIIRDIDILKQIQKRSKVIICITITTFDDELAKIIEPGAPSTSRRFEALKLLSDNGIYCGITLMPILPKINDDSKNIEQIMQKAKEVGAKFISPFYGLTLRDGQREYYYDKLDKHFPGASEYYSKEFGSTYSCHSPSSKKLYALTERLCKEYDIQYKRT